MRRFTAADAVTTEAIKIVRKEGLSIPVRALVMLIVVLMLAPTLEFHFDY